MARTLTVSLYPRHRDILKRREHELNLHRSVIIQLLLEGEERDGTLRRELIKRFGGASASVTVPPAA